MESRTHLWDFHAFNEKPAPAPAPAFISVGEAGPSVEIMYEERSSMVTAESHLTSLKLGKRNLFEHGERRSMEAVGKRSGGKGFSNGSSSSPAPMCQVEGCNIVLVDAKEYHRRHKVCEKHSKAPKVVVLGIEQRFCQQCSRFHVVSEFDNAKRSCRRRLAGHNARRRKSSSETSGPQENKTLGGDFSCISSTSRGRVLSLLSPSKSLCSSSWGDRREPISSSVSSAALRELIAEKRAAVHSMQLSYQHCSWPHAENGVGKGQAFISFGQTQEAAEWNQFH